MAVLRRELLLPWLSPRRCWRPPEDARQGRAQHGQRQGAADRGRVLLAHLPALRRVRPEVAAGDPRREWIAPGRLRWVFYDFPTDKAALQAAMVARYLPAERYDRGSSTRCSRTRTAGCSAPAAWPMRSGRWRATPAWTAPPSTVRSIDAGLQDWIVQRALTAEQRWHVDCNSQLRDQRQALYGGYVAPGNLLQFSEVSGRVSVVRAVSAACASPASRASPNRSAWRSIRG